MSVIDGLQTDTATHFLGSPSESQPDPHFLFVPSVLPPLISFANMKKLKLVPPTLRVNGRFYTGCPATHHAALAGRSDFEVNHRYQWLTFVRVTVRPFLIVCLMQADQGQRKNRFIFVRKDRAAIDNKYHH
jgi:hypothetical protein